MPRKFEGYEPDAIDCDQLSRALAEDFGVICTMEVSYALDKVQTVARCHRPTLSTPSVVVVQALVSRPIKAAKSHYVAQYSVMLDCWHQLDRGAAAVVVPPISHGWDRRPQVPRRRQ
jgi:hypothetical protein